MGTQEKKMRIDKIRLFLGVFEQKFVKCTIVRTKITKIRPNLTHFFATLTNTYGFTQEKKMRIDKIRLFLGVFEQKIVKCTIVRTKIPKIRPNLTHFFATLTKTYGFTQEKKMRIDKIRLLLGVFEQKFVKCTTVRTKIP